MSGTKTHEHQVRQFEHGGDSQNWAEGDGSGREPDSRNSRQTAKPGGASQQGTNQESRDHNKHNDPGQSAHKPQQHGPKEEKQ